MKRWQLIGALAAVAAFGGCVETMPTLPAVKLGNPPLASPGAPPPIRTDAQITTALMEIVESPTKFKVDLSKVQPGTPMGDLVSLGSPIGYQLRNRYLNIGIAEAEALASNSDPVFRERLINMARWEADGETRAAAMVALATTHDTVHYDIFREALMHLDIAVRFGALEAMIVWSHPEKSLPLFSQVADSDAEPILRVYASGAMARFGDPTGLIRLRQGLESNSWLVRAMSARYLGDYGAAGDYDLIVSRIGQETMNDFVAAEYCIAALKLFPKKLP